MLFLNRIAHPMLKMKVFFHMTVDGSKEKLDGQLADTLQQMAAITDTIKNSLSQSERYDELALASIKTIDNVGTQLSASLVSLISIFKVKESVSNADAVLAHETIAQCNDFIKTLQPYLHVDD